MKKAQDVIKRMESLKDDGQRENLMRFFKTKKPTDYGYGDEFLGIKVPVTRGVVREYCDLPLAEVPRLLTSRWHEIRLCGFLILVSKFMKLTKKKFINDVEATKGRDEIVTMYLKYAEYANNWDLVDLSVSQILGAWFFMPTFLGSEDGSLQMNRNYKIKVFDELAESDCLWKQRMSVVASWMTNKMGDEFLCLRYAERHVHHSHDLMHKAVGWMLRDMGVRISMDLLRNFLKRHSSDMPRTMLRYAIEKMSPEERQMWMKR